MEINFENRFHRDIKKNKSILKGINEVIIDIKKVHSINEIKGIRKIVNKKRIYRIKTKELKTIELF